MDPSSLIPKATAHPDLVALVHSHLSNDMVKHLAQKCNEALNIEIIANAHGLPTPPMTPATPAGRTRFAEMQQLPPLPSLEDFIRIACKQSHLPVPTVLATLIYLERLKKKLPSIARGMESTRHRVFLACLNLAAKYLNDSAPKNKSYMRCSAFTFSTDEINLMELQLIFLLNFDLRFSEEDACHHFAPFLPGGKYYRGPKNPVARLVAPVKVKPPTLPRMPITPPYDAVPPTISVPQPSISSLSSTLASTHIDKLPPHIQRALRPPMYPTSSSESIASLTEDNGTSSSSSDSSEDELPVPSALPTTVNGVPNKRFVLNPVPVAARKGHTRKASIVSITSTEPESMSPPSRGVVSFKHVRQVSGQRGLGRVAAAAPGGPPRSTSTSGAVLPSLRSASSTAFAPVSAAASSNSTTLSHDNAAKPKRETVGSKLLGRMLGTRSVSAGFGSSRGGLRVYHPEDESDEEGIGRGYPYSQGRSRLEPSRSFETGYEPEYEYAV